MFLSKNLSKEALATLMQISYMLELPVSLKLTFPLNLNFTSRANIVLDLSSILAPMDHITAKAIK